MKSLYIVLFFITCVTAAFGQFTLTGRDNAPVPGDSSRTREISYTDPGNAGANVAWDFSALRFTGKSTFRGVREAPASNSGEGTALLLSEEGFDYTSLLTGEELVERSYVHSTRRMTMEYSDPIIKMKYPFAYGQRYSDTFSGVVLYNGSSRTEVEGTWSVAADAFGTLILPDRILRNTLRLRTVKNSLQLGVCGSTQVNVERYYWYAPGYRYPVLMIGRTDSRRGGGDPVITYNCWLNLDQNSRSLFTQGAGNPAETGGTGVIVFPNPFTETVSYQYFLRRAMPVKVQLYDISGKSVQLAEPMQMQNEGLHSGSVDAASLGLTPGVYYLRFTLDRQVIVSKVVKI